MQCVTRTCWILAISAGCGRIGFAPIDGDAPGGAIDAPAFQLDAGECPPGYVFEAGSCYLFGGENVDVTWQAAEALCEQVGAHLVVVDSAAEAAFVDTLAGSTVQTHWIGISDRVTEGTYRLVTGPIATYLPWQAGEPSGNPDEHCGEFHDSQEFGATDCNDPSEYLCEYDGLPADPSAH